MKRLFIFFAIMLSLLAWSGTSRASLVYSASSGDLAASASFDLSGSTLTVTLTNTSTKDVLVPSNILTGLFFNTTHTLTPVSASLNGSNVYYKPLVNNVGEGWQYKSNISAQTMNSGISAAGFNVFGPSGNFYSTGVTLDGVDYGILSAQDDTLTGNGGVSSGGPLIKNSIKFTLTADSGFSLSELGDTVVFQYGTSLLEPYFSNTEPPVGVGVVPIPPTVWLLGSGLIGFWGIRRRFLKK